VDQLDFGDFDDTQFEEFCFGLLEGLPGFRNVDWRKGTPKKTSPSDRGRDITAEVDHFEVDGARNVETWFADAKHYKSAVPPTAFDGLLAWTHAERPHVALIIVSGFLSNGAKDYLEDYERNNRPPFRIKYWERPTIDRLARENPELLARFFTSSTPWTPTDAEHNVQCQLAGCQHPAVFDEPAGRTAQGWCGLCRGVAEQQVDELMALGARRKRSSRAEDDA
jgi:hypothetical protein